MKQTDRIYTECPFYGIRKITKQLRRQGNVYNHKRTAGLMRITGTEAIMPKRNLSKADKDNVVFPYLLKGVEILSSNQVWSAGITYIPVRTGFVYLTAVTDWFSRYVLSRELSGTMDVNFCLSVPDNALKQGRPGIFSTGQGSQYTGKLFTEFVLKNEIKFSMDSKGRAPDNIFTERFRRSLKYENIYLSDYQNGQELFGGLKSWFHFYNYRRPHQASGYKTPAEIYC